MNAFALTHSKNVPMLTSGVARTHPRSQIVLQECVRAYIRCCENASGLRAPFIFGPEWSHWIGELCLTKGCYNPTQSQPITSNHTQPVAGLQGCATKPCEFIERLPLVSVAESASICTCMSIIFPVLGKICNSAV